MLAHNQGVAPGCTYGQAFGFVFPPWSTAAPLLYVHVCLLARGIQPGQSWYYCQLVTTSNFNPLHPARTPARSYLGQQELAGVTTDELHASNLDS